MPKEDKPLEYQHRVRDTKVVAQRLDLEYLNRATRWVLWRRRLSWLLPAAGLAVSIPLLLGIGGSKKALSPGPVSRAHAIFESRCEVCHAQSFASVPDQACQRCHDGPAHPAKLVDTGVPKEPKRGLHCAHCHLEHRGNLPLADVRDSNCTACHAALRDHGTGVRLQNVEITRFREKKHPEFSAASRADLRPLRLNHKVHMELLAKKNPGMKLPMKCSDCHVTDLNSPKGDLLPVTFELNCRSCHSRQLEFDVYQVLPANTPAPHTKDTNTIHVFIAEKIQATLAGNPSLVKQTLRWDLEPVGKPDAWLKRVITDSERLLFDKRCSYCHEYESQTGPYPVVKRVGQIRGQYVAGKPEGLPWFERGEFSHRAHRAVECTSCHTAAKTSTHTSDVLIPKLQDCARCHGASGTSIDRCAECHLYHNKSREKDKDRRPVEQLISRALPRP